MAEIRILIVSAHALFRTGVVLTLAAEPEFAIVAASDTADGACQAATVHRPDLVVLDATLPDDVLQVLARIIAGAPAARVLMMTDGVADPRVAPAMQNGAWGYALKSVSDMELVAALRVIHGGHKFVAPAIAAQLFSKPAAAPPDRACVSNLSAREGQILDLLVEGLSNKEIGGRLRISEKTVKHYLTIVLEKLNVKNRVQAAIIAYGQSQRALAAPDVSRWANPNA